MNEVTKYSFTKTDVFVESQLIKDIQNPSDFKEKVSLAKQELKDIKNVIADSINNKGQDGRSPVELLNERRRATTMNNIVERDLNNLQKLYNSGAIKSEEFEKGLETVVETLGSDLGLKIDVRFADDSTKMPNDSKSSIGSAYTVTNLSRSHNIYIDRSQIKETSQLIGIMFEEVSHILDGVAGRQNLEVANGTSLEYGLESLGKPTGEYFENRYREKSKSISLKKDDIDYSDVEIDSIKVGDFCEFNPNNCKLDGGVINSTKIKLPKVEMTLEQRKNEKQLSSFILDVILLVGDMKGIVEAILGVDFITQEELGLLSRLLNTIPVISELKKGFKLVKGLGKTTEVVLLDGTRIALKADDVFKLTNKVSDSRKIDNLNIKKISRTINRAEILKEIEETNKILSQNKNVVKLKNTIKGQKMFKVDDYVLYADDFHVNVEYEVFKNGVHQGTISASIIRKNNGNFSKTLINKTKAVKGRTISVK